MECKIKRNSTHCPCTYSSCSRRGICCDCVEYHRKKKEIPGCFFPPDAERTWDRSIENFINSWKK